MYIGKEVISKMLLYCKKIILKFIYSKKVINLQFLILFI
jgi:hypothetical protein